MGRRARLVAALILALAACTSGTEPPEDAAPTPPAPSASPAPISIRVSSNMTRAPLVARATFQGGSATGDPAGLIIVAAHAGTEIAVSADGYEEKRLTLPTAGLVNAELNADPGTTMKQLDEWEKVREFAKIWDWVHPDAYNYISKAAYIQTLTHDADAGYQPISVEILDVAYVAWTFAKCRIARYGPRQYRSAVVRFKRHDSSPGGRTETVEGATHYVRTPDGRWRFFPLAGCESRPR